MKFLAALFLRKNILKNICNIVGKPAVQICVCSLKYVIIPAKLSIHLLIISHINFNFLPPPLLQDYRPGREAPGDALRPPPAAGRRGRVQHRRLPAGQEDLRAVVPPPLREVIPRGVRTAKGEGKEGNPLSGFFGI